VSQTSDSREEIEVQVLFINNDGGGFADTIDVPDGTTVAALFADKMPGRKPGDFLIRVNRLPAAADQALRTGDRVSFTPTKIEGAAA
jgi:hypothetical protein